MMWIVNILRISFREINCASQFLFESIYVNILLWFHTVYQQYSITLTCSAELEKL